MKFDPNQYRLAFFAEAADHLSALEAALLRLDAGSDAGAVDEAFRSAHTIKGGADVVGLDAVARPRTRSRPRWPGSVRRPGASRAAPSTCSWKGATGWPSCSPPSAPAGPRRTCPT